MMRILKNKIALGLASGALLLMPRPAPEALAQSVKAPTVAGTSYCVSPTDLTAVPGVPSADGGFGPSSSTCKATDPNNYIGRYEAAHPGTAPPNLLKPNYSLASAANVPAGPGGNPPASVTVSTLPGVDVNLVSASEVNAALSSFASQTNATLAATGGLSSVATDGTLTGDGRAASPLRVAPSVLNSATTAQTTANNAQSAAIAGQSTAYTALGLAENSVQYDNPAHSSVTLNQGRGQAGLHSVGPGVISASSTDAVDGAQLYATNQNITNVTTHINNGTIGLVEQQGGAPGRGTITVGAATGGMLIDVTGTGGVRRMTGVAPGTVSASSSDAINGSQLNGVVSTVNNLSASTAANFGGGSAYNPTIGTVSAPSYTIGASTYNTVGSALAAINTTGIQYFHANSKLGDSSAVGANSVAVGPLAKAAGADSIAQGHSATGNQAGDVAIGLNATATGVAGSGSAVSIGNGNAASGAGAVAIGDPNTATGTGAVALGANNTADGNGVVSLGNASNAQGQGSIALGNTSQALGAGSLALGDTAQASAAKGVALGSGAVAANANDVAVGSNSVTSAPHAGAYTINGGTIAAAAPASVVSVGQAGQERQIRNVGAGVISASSTDAINGSQFFAVGSAVNNLGSSTASYFGGGSSYNSSTGAVSAPSYTVANKTYNDVGSALSKLNQQVNGPTPTVVRYDTDGSGNPTNSVTLTGAQNGQGVQIHNLSAGTIGTDAANLNQLQSVSNAGRAYTDQQVSGLRGYVDNRFAGDEALISKASRTARAAGAAGMATANLRYDDRPYAGSVAAAVGGFMGQTALASGVAYNWNTVRVQGSVSYVPNTNAIGWGAGASWRFW
jgi:hypothetical protein